MSSAAALKRRGGPQSERLANAIINLSAGTPPGNLPVARIASHAGVSTATFYDLFDDKPRALLQAHLAARRRLLAGALERLEGRRWPEAGRHVLRDLLTGIARDPHAGWMLCVHERSAEGILATELDRGAGNLEQRIEGLLRQQPCCEGVTLDIPAAALIGGVRAVIAGHLWARSEHSLPALLVDLVGWCCAYQVPAGTRRWSEGDGAPVRDAAPVLASPRARERRRVPESVLLRSQRRRLINATAEVTLENGYQQSTVEQIVARAGVARSVFYEHFASKQDAFAGAQRHGAPHVLELCARAYFAHDRWPDRVCGGLHTLLALIAENPAMAHLQLVECHRAGPDASRRGHALTRTLASFLHEGYAARPGASPLPALCAHASAGAVLSLIGRCVQEGEPDRLPATLAQLAYLALAPALGAECARTAARLYLAQDRGPSALSACPAYPARAGARG
jgi:AcrR family transcriptional regulator